MKHGFLGTVWGVLRPVWFVVKWPVQIGASILFVSAIISAAWTTYFGGPAAPTRPAVPSNIPEAVARVCQQVPGDLPKPPKLLRPTLVLPLVGDRELPEGDRLVTRELRQAIAADGAYSVVEQGPVEQFVARLFKAIGQPAEPVTDATTAIRLGKQARAEVVVLGRVEKLERTESGSIDVALEVRLFDVATGEKLFDGSFPKPAASQPLAVVGVGPGRLVSIWLGLGAFALIWPPVTSPIMRRVLRMESNIATLLAIVLITAVPAGLAWLLVLYTDAGFWPITACVLGTALVGLWCMTVMSWVAQDEA